MNTPVYKETYQGHQIAIHHDTDPMSPRDWDNLGIMICKHRRYNLGDNHDFSDARQFLLDLCDLSEESELSLDRMMAIATTKAIILPLFLYDHSGITMNTTGFHCPWDSGQVGFIYATLKSIREEYSVKRVSSSLRQRVSEQLKAEVATYDNYLTGNSFGYTITKIADGGISEASVPPAATTPAANCLLYPTFSISGIAIRANTAAVATDDSAQGKLL